MKLPKLWGTCKLTSPLLLQTSSIKVIEEPTLPQTPTRSKNASVKVIQNGYRDNFWNR